MQKIKVILLLLLPVLGNSQDFIVNTGIIIVNNTDLVSTGSWSNVVGTVTTNNGTITAKDSWTNAGTLNGTGSFTIDFATDKNFSLGNSTIPFLIKKGAGAAIVAGSIHVKDSLDLSSGSFKLGATDTLVMVGGKVKPGTTTFVDGLFAHTGKGNKLFPLGRDGYALPMRLIKLDASRATASLALAPAGYTAGAAVDALIDFPYVWKVTAKLATDTSAQVELDYPNTLPTTATPVVVREVPGSQYASMGARLTTNTNGVVTVRSYSRGLRGTFTVANGFPGSLATDSLALVALYNNTDGANWNTKTNWLSGRVSTWSGVTVTGQNITQVRLPNNKLIGPAADELSDIIALQNLDLSGNAVNTIPDFSESTEITNLNVSGNRLEFGSLEPNKGFVNATGVTFNYSNQGDIGDPIETLVDVGTDATVEANTSGTNTYVWKREDVVVSDAADRTYAIKAINRSNMGSYVCEIENTYFPGLTIKTATNNVLAVATLEGKLFSAPATAATKGKMTLLKIANSGYDTTAVKQINTDGTYKAEKIVLADYILLGFVDTLTYANALPSYYGNTIYWEEADTIMVNSDLDSLDVISDYEPTNPPTGVGVISGYLTQDDGLPGGRSQKQQRVAGAGVSVRKVENTGRGQEEILTLVAYVYTDAQGNFTLPNLAAGNYRLNIQYPGYPMDPTSFITMTIGDGIKSDVRVAAEVKDKKIKVTKITITNVWAKEDYTADVFPNPSVDYIQLKFSVPSTNRLIKLLDIKGREVNRFMANSLTAQSDVSQLAPGVYILQVIDQDEIMKTIRVVKE